MPHLDDNPFASPRAVGKRLTGALPFRTRGNRAALSKRSLLYRRIEVDAPVQATIEYIGRSLRDRILVNGRLVAWRLPIMGLSHIFQFDIRTADESLPSQIVVEVNMWLKLTKFELQILGETVYRESRGMKDEPPRSRRK